MISNKDESSRKKIDKLSTDKILLSAVQMVDAKHNSFPATHLDIGSGTGSLIRLLRAKFQVLKISSNPYQPFARPLS